MGEIDMIKAAVGAVDKVGAKVLPEDIIKLARQSAMAAAGIALIPQGATVAMVVNIGVMCGRINNQLGIKIAKNKLNSVVSGLLTALGMQTLVRMGVTEIFKDLIPGLGTLGGTAVQMYLFAGATYTAAFIYLKSLSQLDEINKDNVASDKIISEIGDFAKNSKDQIADMLVAAKEMFKSLKKSDAEVAKNEINAEVEEARVAMTADGKNLDEEVKKFFELNEDKESFKKSKFERASGWLKSKFK